MSDLVEKIKDEYGVQINSNGLLIPAHRLPEILALVEPVIRAKVNEWQPIETAPTDGNHIQLYRPEIQFVGYYGGANSGWRINAPGLPAMWPLPTHWAELRKIP